MTEDQGRVRGKVESDRTKRVEGQSAVKDPEVCGADRATTDHGGVRGIKEPSGAIRTTAPGGFKGGRS